MSHTQPCNGLPMEEAAAETSSSMTKESLNSDSASSSPAEQGTFTERRTGANNGSIPIIARGIASVFGPVMNNLDARVEGALKSQSVLASSIDHLTRELDKLLEDAPLPFVIQHTTKLSGVRKRVVSLNSSLRIIQKRMDSIERMLLGPASKARAAMGKQGSIPLFETNKDTVSATPPPAGNSSSCIEIPLKKTLSFGSSNDHVEEESCSEDRERVHEETVEETTLDHHKITMI